MSEESLRFAERKRCILTLAVLILTVNTHSITLTTTLTFPRSDA